MIRDVTHSDLERVRAFLEAHVDTSLFLLSNLAVLGPRLGDHLNSGNYRLLEEAGRVAAVFCLTRRGNLLVQAGGRAELAEQILEACEREPVEVRGVIGEWPTAEALWDLLRADARFEPMHNAKDVLYRLMLSNPVPANDASDDPHRRANSSPAGITVRALEAEDFAQWERLNTAYLAELSLPLEGTPAQRKSEFVSRANARLWWGAFAAANLVATVGLNATYGLLGQVGGVYTRPEERRKGLARIAMTGLIEDCRGYHQFEKLILFTGEDNHGARRLYESLGFQPAGAFGLLLGSRRSHVRARVRHKWAGQSGEVYTYDVYEWPARLTPGPGNFIFTSNTPTGGWRPVLIGESADLSGLALQERLHSGAGRPQATHVHVRLNFNPASVRRREANDLAERWMPPDHDPLA